MFRTSRDALLGWRRGNDALKYDFPDPCLQIKWIYIYIWYLNIFIYMYVCMYIWISSTYIHVIKKRLRWSYMHLSVYPWICLSTPESVHPQQLNKEVSNHFIVQVCLAPTGIIWQIGTSTTKSFASLINLNHGGHRFHGLHVPPFSFTFLAKFNSNKFSAGPSSEPGLPQKQFNAKNMLS